MIMGILSSMLSGAAYGTELGNMEDGPQPGQDGHFVAAIRVDAFEAVDRFKSRVDQAVRQIHDSRRAAGVDRIYVTGELEFIRQAEYEADGIPLNDVTLSDLFAAAQAMGIDAAQIEAIKVMGGS
jgi:LDH2 family malate/lactate/ureidoglycolate dehydrogenase